MINFKEELAKYEPILEIDDIENTIHSNELQDMFDILQHISRQKNNNQDEDIYGQMSFEYSKNYDKE